MIWFLRKLLIPHTAGKGRILPSIVTDPGQDHGPDPERKPDPVIILGVFRNPLQSLIIRREKGKALSANPVQQRSLALTRSLIKFTTFFSKLPQINYIKVERNYFKISPLNYFTSRTFLIAHWFNEPCSGMWICARPSLLCPSLCPVPALTLNFIECKFGGK